MALRTALLGVLASVGLGAPANSIAGDYDEDDGIALGIAFTTEGLTISELAGTIETLRVGASWSTVQPSCRAIRRGRYDWRRTDRTMRRALAAEKPILLTLGGAPRCAAAVRGRHAFQPDRAHTREFARFGARVIERYGPEGRLTTKLGSCCGVTRLEVWNEPNIRNHWARPSAKAYARLLKAVSKRVRRSSAGRRVEIATAGLAASSAVEYLRKLLSVRRMGRHVDAVGLHTYAPSPRRSLKLIAAVRRRMSAAGHRRTPIVVSEHAWSTCASPSAQRFRGKCTTPGGQAEMLRGYVEGLRDRPELGVDTFLWYTPQDLGRPANAHRCPASPKFFYGLFDVAGHPKPAWWVWQELVRKLGPASLPPVEGHRQKGCR